MKKNRAVVVTTSVGSRDAARKLASRIVEAGLAACVQYAPARSVYRWKGRVESANEFVLAAKTRASLAGALTAFIRERHSYELPEITVMRIADGLPEYLDWIEAETRDGKSATRGRSRSRGRK